MKKYNSKGNGNPVLKMPSGEKLKALEMPKGKKDYIVPDAICKK